MSHQSSTPGMINRRQAIRSTLRWTGLAALTGAAAFLAKRSLNQGCTTTGPCGACPMLRDCDLPKARSAQQSPDKPAYPSRPSHG